MSNLSEKEKKREIRENLKIYLKIVVFNGYFMFFENINIIAHFCNNKNIKSKEKGNTQKYPCAIN